MADLDHAAAVSSLQKPHQLQKDSVKIQSWKIVNLETQIQTSHAKSKKM